MNLNFIDYESKLKKDFLNLLGKEKYKNESIESLFHLYFNKLNKQISKKNYKVFISDELMNIQNPNKDIILEIKKDFENGNINLLNKRLSKASIKEDENDLLLNNWGIYHLHLGKLDNNDFSARTKLLLFIKIINDNVYFLDVKEHGNFSSIDFIKIMHNNWEKEIEIHRIENFVDIEPKYDEKDVFKLWKIGVNAILTFIDKNNNEVAYLPIGGGTTSANTSSVEAFKWIKLMKILNNMNKKLDSKCYLRFAQFNKMFFIQNKNGKNLYYFDFDSL